MNQSKLRVTCPTCGHCPTADAGPLLALLQEAGVATVDSAGVLTMAAGARALDGDALDSLIAEAGRGEMSPESLRAIVERAAPD
mgnify:CR=1 FL=1